MYFKFARLGRYGQLLMHPALSGLGRHGVRLQSQPHFKKLQTFMELIFSVKVNFVLVQLSIDGFIIYEVDWEYKGCESTV